MTSSEVISQLVYADPTRSFAVAANEFSTNQSNGTRSPHYLYAVTVMPGYDGTPAQQFSTEQPSFAIPLAMMLATIEAESVVA